MKIIKNPLFWSGTKNQVSSLGGKFIPLKLDANTDNVRPLQLFSSLSSLLQSQDHHVTNLIAQSTHHLQWLDSKPTGIPLFQSFSVSSEFGPRTDPFNQRESFHSGLDFQSPVGTLIAASASGRVLKASWDANYDRLLIIDHGDGFLSRYAHTQEIFVQPGALVKRNQVVASVGTSGRSTGPHLHYEIVRNGEVINPKEMLVGLNNR